MANLSGTEDDDVLDGTPESDDISGNGGNDQLNGLAGSDALHGGAGNDRLDGGEGEDAMDGGTGDDVYIVDNGGDVVTELAGEGTDEVRTNLAVYTLADNVENLTGTSSSAQRLTGNSGNNLITVGSGAFVVDGGAGIDHLSADLSATGFMVYIDLRPTFYHTAMRPGDRFTSIEALHNFRTGSGDDTIVTTILFASDSVWLGAGRDSFTTERGVDFADGGEGDEDTLIVNYFPSTAVTSGTNSFSQGASRIDFTGFEYLRITTGDGADSVVTGATIDWVRTGNGNDSVAAGEGDDFVDGGRGDDVLDGGLGIDTLSYMLGGYSSSVSASVTVDLELTGAQDTGASGFDTLSNFENLIGAKDGDVLKGTDSANLIDGWFGADVMIGRGGDDVYIVDHWNDQVVEEADEGDDEVRTSLGFYELPDNIERLSVTAPPEAMAAGSAGPEGDEADSQAAMTREPLMTAEPARNHTLFGNDLDNVITGGTGNDTINGYQGADWMAGGLGQDVYVVDDVGDRVIEFDGGGRDALYTDLGSKAPPDRLVYVIPDFVEDLIGTAAGAQGVRDNALDNVIFMGGGHDLVVVDSGGVDSIDAGGGNDFIYHGDKLTAADVTNGGSGTDTIGLLGNYGAGLTFTAANLVGVERMALYTSLYQPGAGPNDYAITMNDANVASGTEFFVTAASLQSNESLTFNGAAETNGRFTVHGGGGADTITGGAGGDFIIGNGGNDALYGLGGTDFLTGGLGADQLRGGAGGDFFRYLSTAHSTTGSVDRILDFQHVDRIDLSAIDADGNGGNGDQAFAFIGSNAFTSVAGQLRAYQSGNSWFVEGDTNGDGLADLVIQVTVADATAIVAADFVL